MGVPAAQGLIRESARQIVKAGRADRVILGSPSNGSIWKMCGAALPGAPRILPMTEVRQGREEVFLFHLFQPPRAD